MGLRSPSAWTGRDSSSQWTDNSGKGLTQAQERMDKATSPAAGQAQTEVTKPGEVTAEAYNAQQEQQKQAKEQAKQQKAGGFNPIEQQLQQAESKLSTFGSTLRAYTNQFLQGAAQTSGTTGGYTAQYGANGIAFTDNTMADVSGVQEQKLAEQKKIQDLMGTSGFTRDIGGKLYGKEFTEAMSMAGEGFDTDVRGHINSLTGMVSKLDELQAKGLGRSSEAQALEAQLAEMDSTGMVTGLRQSRDSYNKLMGLTPGKEERWYAGQGGTGYTALELAKMDSAKVNEEVEKALSFSSGLFGGDFSSNLKSLFDSESADVRASQQRESAIQKELSRGFQEWEGSKSEAVKASMDAVNSKLGKIAQDLASEAQGSNDTAAAAIWMSAAASGDLTKFFSNMISDPKNGMSTDQRSKLQELMGTLQAGSGDVGSLMNQIATSGQVTLDGKTYRPNTSEKLAMMRIMQDDTLQEEQKSAKLKEAIGNLAVGGTTLNSQMAAALKTINDTGVDEVGVNLFKNSVKASMKSFISSKTEHAVRDALGIDDTTWNNTSASQKDELMKDAWTKLDPQQQKDFMQTIVQKAATADTQNKAYVEENEKKVADAVSNVDVELKKIDDKTGNVVGSIAHAKNQPAAIAQALAQPFQGKLYSTGNLVESFDRSQLPPLLQKEYDKVAPLYKAYRQAEANYQRVKNVSVTGLEYLKKLDVAQKALQDAERQGSGLVQNIQQGNPDILYVMFADNPAIKSAEDNITKLEEARRGFVSQKTQLGNTANNIATIKDGLDDVVFSPESIVNVALKRINGAIGSSDLTGITGEHQVKDANDNVTGIDLAGKDVADYTPWNTKALPTTVNGPNLGAYSVDPGTGGYGKNRYTGTYTANLSAAPQGPSPEPVDPLNKPLPGEEALDKIGRLTNLATGGALKTVQGGAKKVLKKVFG